MEIQLRLSESSDLQLHTFKKEDDICLQKKNDPFPMLKVPSFCTTILGRVLYEV